MKQGKARGRTNAEGSTTAPTHESVARAIDDACKLLADQERRTAELRRRERRKGTPAPKPIKRELRQMNIVHWWREPAFIERISKGEVPIEEQKAAVWYEAARRRPEVQQAWLQGKSEFGDTSWQEFTIWVVKNIPRIWPDLDSFSKAAITKASYSPWSIPPCGLSTFPETDKIEQQSVAMQVLELPEPTESSDAAQRFVEHARKFRDAGFLIVAIDKKQNQAVRAALGAIEDLPQTFRKVDMTQEVVPCVPPGTPDADLRALEQKAKDGTLQKRHIRALWRKGGSQEDHPERGFDLLARVEERVLHKRLRKGRPVESMQFSFERSLRQLESCDKGCTSEIVNAIRL